MDGMAEIVAEDCPRYMRATLSSKRKEGASKPCGVDPESPPRRGRKIGGEKMAGVSVSKSASPPNSSSNSNLNSNLNFPGKIGQRKAPPGKTETREKIGKLNNAKKPEEVGIKNRKVGKPGKNSNAKGKGEIATAGKSAVKKNEVQSIKRIPIRPLTAPVGGKGSISPPNANVPRSRSGGRIPQIDSKPRPESAGSLAGTSNSKSGSNLNLNFTRASQLPKYSLANAFPASASPTELISKKCGASRIPKAPSISVKKEIGEYGGNVGKLENSIPNKLMSRAERRHYEMWSGRCALDDVLKQRTQVA